MANYNFKQDITEGERGESIIRQELEQHGAIFLGDNKDNKFDISMKMPNGNTNTFEIKTDVFCKPHKDTNNLFIEFESRGKESGINTTIADFFVTYYPFLMEIWYIKTEKLKQLINDNQFKETEFSGDSGSNTKGYLIPRYQFKKHFKVTIPKIRWEN